MRFGQSCWHVRIVTPKRYLLDALWFGSHHPTTGIIFVHGLGSHAFAHHDYLTKLAARDTAVLYFSNRGHDGIAGIKRIKRGSRKGYIYESAGVAHEVFTDCVDDIQGAVNLLIHQGARRVYLVGHSTGCQKIVFHLSRSRKTKRIAGAVLLCPISDYASAKHEDEKRRQIAEKFANGLVRRKKPHQLLPETIWPGPLDAQRFLSLYTPDSKEEIFTYAQPRKIPRTLRRVKTPLLVVFAGDDEYRDRDTEEIAKWFRANLRAKVSDIEIIPGAQHSFRGKETKLARVIQRWITK
jgi:alpha-beta hydrolase superfamily lysophospholipase